MKTKTLIAVALLAIGCGATFEPPIERDTFGVESDDVTPQYVDDLPDAAAIAGDFGVAEQALIVLAAGYGKDDNGRRCHAPWAGGHCRVPGKKSRLVVLPPAGNCTASFRNAFVRAASYWQTQLSSRGWTLDVREDTGEGLFNISLACGSPRSGATSGEMASSKDETINLSSCQTVSGAGKLCPMSRTSVRLYTARMDAATASSTTQIREAWFESIARHELGHALGLGHDTCSETKLMGQGVTDNCFNVGENAVNASSFELSMLRDYKP